MLGSRGRGNFNHTRLVVPETRDSDNALVPKYVSTIETNLRYRMRIGDDHVDVTQFVS